MEPLRSREDKSIDIRSLSCKGVSKGGRSQKGQYNLACLDNLSYVKFIRQHALNF